MVGSTLIPGLRCAAIVGVGGAIVMFAMYAWHAFKIAEDVRDDGLPANALSSTECDELLNVVVLNDNVHWHHHFSGFAPDMRAIGAVIDHCQADLDRVDRKMIAWLDDPSRFLAAHVALCCIRQRAWEIGPDVWNGVSDKVVVSHKIEDQERIKAFWVK